MIQPRSWLPILVSIVLLGCSYKKSPYVPPSISLVNGEYVLNIPGEMSKALKKLNPKFVPWKTSDYTWNVITDISKSKDSRRAPFALVFDINRDNLLDVVIDGHDDKNALLVCIYSEKNNFKAIQVREEFLFDPKSIENFYDGKKDLGIPYFLWPPNPETKTPKLNVFSVAYPQPLDASGKECGDAHVIDYTFNNGSFTEETVL